MAWVIIQFSDLDIEIEKSRHYNLFASRFSVRMGFSDGADTEYRMSATVEEKDQSIQGVIRKAVESIFDKRFCSLEKYLPDNFVILEADYSDVRVDVTKVPEDIGLAILQIFAELYKGDASKFLDFIPKRLTA